ncbi:hypothetical protein [Oceaniglobus indicus]|uniref:hypothetical protein n=1 Tax=Oceaniglobus indicus TaxID=2047749 RepID=UPI001472CB31|nr:hypothetical protein [Oceaniglobus indicus]
MNRIVLAIATLCPTLAFAAPFQRPIPQPQSATAEWWFFAASVGLLVALLAVHLLVRRR